MHRVLCFGEVLWDVLPHGFYLGGAPLNVAFHLRQLGLAPVIVSAVGEDALGDEARSAIAASGVDGGAVGRHASWPTGTALVELDAAGQASYRFPGSVAWDDIPVDGVLEGPAPAAIVFGTLALRTAANRAALMRVLDAYPEAWVVCDLNLRPPHDDLEPLAELLAKANLLKFNADEACALAGLNTVNDDDVIAALRDRFGGRAVCVTRGARGAIIADQWGIWRAPSPSVEVVDTIGAGDAFTAGLIAGRLRDDGGNDWRVALESAVRLGAFVASRAGAQPPHVNPVGQHNCS